MKEITTEEFKKIIKEGIPDLHPPMKESDAQVNHAPKRKEILNNSEKKLEIQMIYITHRIDTHHGIKKAI